MRMGQIRGDLPMKLHARCFPSHVMHHEMCTWIYQQDPI